MINWPKPGSVLKDKGDNSTVGIVVEATTTYSGSNPVPINRCNVLWINKGLTTSWKKEGSLLEEYIICTNEGEGDG